MTRIGMWYATGPAETARPLPAKSDPAFNVHRVVSDAAEHPGCVTVENAAGQHFAVPVSLIDDIAARAGEG